MRICAGSENAKREASLLWLTGGRRLRLLTMFQKQGGAGKHRLGNAPAHRLQVAAFPVWAPFLLRGYPGLFLISMVENRGHRTPFHVPTTCPAGRAQFCYIYSDGSSEAAMDRLPTTPKKRDNSLGANPRLATLPRHGV